MKAVATFSLMAVLCCTSGLAQSTEATASSSADKLPDAPAVNNRTTQPQASAENIDLKGVPKRFLQDEVGIFTAPARTSRSDLKWLIPLAGVTAVALATDSHTMRDVVSHDPSFNAANSTASDVLRGAAIGVPVLLFGVGHLRSDDPMRRTGLLAGQAMVDAYAFDEVIKYATLRERPNIDNARGHFWSTNAVSDPSFISGHSIVAWSSAAVLAGEYNRPWQQAAIYTLASGVSLTRVLSQNHFPTDALLGSAAGWLIGRYVFRSHTRRSGITH